MGSVALFRWISGYPIAVADQGFNGSPESCGSWHHGCNRVPHQQDRQTIIFLDSKSSGCFGPCLNVALDYTYVHLYENIDMYRTLMHADHTFASPQHHKSQANVSYSVGSVNPPFVLHDWNSLPPVKAGLEKKPRQKDWKVPAFWTARISLLRAQDCPSLLVERDAIGQSLRSHREDEQRIACESVFVIGISLIPKERSKSTVNFFFHIEHVFENPALLHLPRP